MSRVLKKPQEGEILTSNEACKFLRIGRTTLWTLTSSGEIPAYRVGTGRTSSLRYFKEELRQWLRKRRIA